MLGIVEGFPGFFLPDESRGFRLLLRYGQAPADQAGSSTEKQQNKISGSNSCVMIAVFQRQIQIGPGGRIISAPEKSIVLFLCQAVNDPHICRTGKGEPKHHILLVVLVIDLVGGCLAALVKLLRTSAVLIQRKLPFMPGRLNGVDELLRIVLTADGNISHISSAVIFQTHIVNIVGTSASTLPVF